MKLEPNHDNIFVCKGRISGEHVIYLPSPRLFTTLVMVDARLETHHGLVVQTMAKVREKYWIERLRSQVKSLIHRRARCKIYHAKPYTDTPTTSLPTFRTTISRALENVVVHFSLPLLYKNSKHDCRKAYVALFSCATSRAVHLDLLEDMTTEEFQRTMKEFMARKGIPSLLVSDNAKTFQSTA